MDPRPWMTSILNPITATTSTRLECGLVSQHTPCASHHCSFSPLLWNALPAPYHNLFSLTGSPPHPGLSCDPLSYAAS